MSLPAYDNKIIYRTGKNNPADYLSRHPESFSKISFDISHFVEEYIIFMVLESVSKSVTLIEIQLQTKNYSLVTIIMGAIKNNSWHKSQKEVSNHDIDAFMRLKMIKEELSVNSDDNVILRDTRLVIPKSLQTRVVTIAHGGHQGVVKCKQLLREKLWFPGIDAFVTQIVNQCSSCQCNNQTIQESQTS